MSARLPARNPIVTDETAPYWEGAAEGRLMLPRCSSCDHVIWMPKTLCVACGSLDVEWFEASGRGTVYSFSVPRRGRGPFEDHLPYVVAYVELEEGPRVFTNIVNCDVDTVRCDMPVEVVFDPTESGHALPRFQPVT